MAVAAILGALGLLDTLGVPEFAGDLLDKALEASFGAKGKDILEEVQARLRAYTGEVPPNHDLEHAIRLAELTATLVLLQQFARNAEAEHANTRSAVPPPFIGKARAWLFDQIGLTPALKVKPNNALVAELNAALDRTLPETRAASIERELASARDRVWAALLAGAGAAPDDFKALFFGEGGEPGWSVLFLAFMREALKTNPRAEVAFLTSRLAAVRSELSRLRERVDSIKGDTTAIRERQEHDSQTSEWSLTM